MTQQVVHIRDELEAILSEQDAALGTLLELGYSLNDQQTKKRITDCASNIRSNFQRVSSVATALFQANVQYQLRALEQQKETEGREKSRAEEVKVSLCPYNTSRFT